MQQTLKGVSVGATEWQLFPAAQNCNVFISAIALYFRYRVEIDDDRAMYTKKSVWGKRLLEVADSISNGVNSRSRMDANVVGCCLDPLNFRATHKNNLTLASDHQAADRKSTRLNSSHL